MAMIGAMIGFSFALSLVAAPALYRAVGMGGLFVGVGLLSLAAIWLVAAVVPDAPHPAHPPGHAAQAGAGLGDARPPGAASGSLARGHNLALRGLDVHEAGIERRRPRG